MLSPTPKRDQAAQFRKANLPASPNSPGYEGDAETSGDDDIPWSKPKDRSPQSFDEFEIADPSDIIPSLEHPRFEKSRWINAYTLETWDSKYTKYAEALERMLREQSRYPPVLIVYIKGSHKNTSKTMGYNFKPARKLSARGMFGERNPVPPAQDDQKLEFEEKSIISEEVDFDIKIDMTYLLAQLPSNSIPPSPRFKLPKLLRPQIKAVEDGKTKMRGGTKPRKFPDSSSFGPGENAVEFWVRQFIEQSTTFCRKRFVLEREVTNFDIARLTSMLKGLIRSTNYQGDIDIEFETTKTTLIVISNHGLADYMHRYWSTFRVLYGLAFLIFLFIYFSIPTRHGSSGFPTWLPLWIIFWLLWPCIYFRTSDFRVLTAEFPFGSDLKNPNNPNTRTTRRSYISGSRVIQKEGKVMVPAEQQFFEDWRNAVRRGVRERFEGPMDVNYLMESNDLTDPRGDYYAMDRRDFKGDVAKPWGGDEKKGFAWNGPAGIVGR